MFLSLSWFVTAALKGLSYFPKEAKQGERDGERKGGKREGAGEEGGGWEKGRERT